MVGDSEAFADQCDRPSASPSTGASGTGPSLCVGVLYQDMRPDVYYLRGFLRDQAGRMVYTAEHMISFWVEGSSILNGNEAR